MRRVFGIELVILLFICFAAHAEEVSFCGSGPTDPMVPESVAGCEMTLACKAHDACYARCDPGGDMHGTVYCGLSEWSPQRRAAKKLCDDKLLIDAVEMNKGDAKCKYVGAIYRRAVILLGQGPFNGRVVKNSDLLQIIERSASPEQAADIWETLQIASQNGIIDPERIWFDQSGIHAPLRSGVAPLVPDKAIYIPSEPSREILEKIKSIN